MNTITAAKQLFAEFAREEDGAQVVEYGLIIAVVSIALIAGLSTLTDANGGFSTFVEKVKTCLTTGTCKY